MIKGTESINNIEAYSYSDTDISSFGSSESECDQEEILPDEGKQLNQFFKNKTQEISHKVLNVCKKVDIIETIDPVKKCSTNNFSNHAEKKQANGIDDISNTTFKL